MKKRLGAVLLSLLIILSLMPATVFAQSQEVTDDNGVTMRYEVTSSPQNGQHYVEGESVVINATITNGGSGILSNVRLYTDSSFVEAGVTLASSLEPGESASTTRSTEVTETNLEQDNAITIDFWCKYELNGRSYDHMAEDTITVPIGLPIPEITGLSAVREDGELTVSFESSFSGSYAYVLLNEGETAPTDWNSCSKADVTEGTNTFTVSDTSETTRICVMLWDENGVPLPNAPVEAEITANTAPSAPLTIEEGFAALEESTQLPYNATIDLGGEGSVLYDLGDGDSAYGKLIKVEAEAGQILNMNFRGAGQNIDTVIEIYRETTSGQFEFVNGFDSDNLNEYGESAQYEISETGVYYLAFLGYADYETGYCQLDISVSTQKIMTIEEGFAALQETTALPYSSKVELGGDNSVLYDLGDGDSAYGKLIKVEAEASRILNMDFFSTGQNIDTVIEVYRETTSGQFELVNKFDFDNANGYGESVKPLISDSGVYYLAFLGYDEYETGYCQLDISVSASQTIVPIEEGFAALQETTALPYSATVDLGGEGAVIYRINDEGNDYYAYAELLKVDLKQDDLLEIGLYSADGSYCDTYLEIYQKTDSGFECLDYFDGTYMEGGELISYTVPADGTYYLAFEGYDISAVGLCQLIANVIPQKNLLTGKLDFTAADVPEPGPNDLWSWDESTKTLTLKDGFYLYNVDPELDDIILLPDDSTVVIERNAKIYTQGGGSIVSEGSLTIRGEDTETSFLEISFDGGDAIDAANNLTVENCRLAICADSDALISDEGTITLRNVKADIFSEDDGVDSRNGDLLIFDSTLAFFGSNEAILSNTLGKNIQIKNSTITANQIDVLISCEGNVSVTDSNISVSEAYAGITVSGTAAIDGGSFSAKFYVGGIGAQKIILNGDLILDLKGLRTDSKSIRTGSMEVNLEGGIRLYDENGGLLYEGKWDPSLYDADTGTIMVNGVPAVSIEAGSHQHIYDQQLVSDKYLANAATCTEPAKYYYSCECGAKGTETFESGAALGHSWGSWQSNGDGTHTRTCRNQNCTADDTENCSAGTAWKSDENVHWNECLTCGEKLNEAAHAFEWVTDKEATATEVGSKHEECTVCGYAKTAVEIPATNTTTSNSQSGNTTASETGDNHNSPLWIVLVLATGTGLATSIIYRRKHYFNAK